MGSHNLAYQIDSAIQQAFRPGADKYSAKHTGENMHIVFSYNEKNSLQQVAYEFKGFMRENHPDIKLIKEVKADHWQGFLNLKSQSCSTATLKNYVSRIGKLQILCQNKFKFKCDWKDGILAPSSQKTPDNAKQRVQVMDKEDLIKVLAYGRSHCTSKAVSAIDICYRFGLRDAEAARLKVKDVDLQKGTLHVIGKGGRHRTLPIRQEDRQILEKLCKGKNVGDSLFDIKAASINQQLNRILKKLGLKSKYPLTSIHAIRKLKAQELWDQKAKTGCTKKEAMNYVSQYLGHGKGRYDILNTYVHNQHLKNDKD